MKAYWSHKIKPKDRNVIKGAIIKDNGDVYQDGKLIGIGKIYYDMIIVETIKAKE